MVVLVGAGPARAGQDSRNLSGTVPPNPRLPAHKPSDKRLCCGERKNIPKLFPCMRRLLRREHYGAENVLEGSLISTDLVLALGLVRQSRPAAAGCGGVGRSEPPRVIF